MRQSAQETPAAAARSRGADPGCAVHECAERDRPRSGRAQRDRGPVPQIRDAAGNVSEDGDRAAVVPPDLQPPVREERHVVPVARGSLAQIERGDGGGEVDDLRLDLAVRAAQPDDGSLIRRALVGVSLVVVAPRARVDVPCRPEPGCERPVEIVGEQDASAGGRPGVRSPGVRGSCVRRAGVGGSCVRSASVPARSTRSGRRVRSPFRGWDSESASRGPRR